MTTEEFKEAKAKSSYAHLSVLQNFVPIDLSGLERSCEAVGIYLNHDQQIMITKLLQIHFTGKLHISGASRDIELSIPDPELLINDGPKELYSKHLYVNITKVSRELNDALKNPMACCCIKTMKFYSIDDLLNMQPIANRDEIKWNKQKYLERFKSKGSYGVEFNPLPSDLDPSMLETDTSFLDETKIVSPGECTSLTELPENHPAIVYLRSRGFYDIKSIEDQFNARFCTVENPRFKHLFRRDDAESMAKFNPLSFFTPQGRIIFSAMMNGTERLWQARVIETTVLGDKYYYVYMGENNPDSTWVKVASYNKDLEAFKTLPKFSNSIIKRKYIIAPGSKSSECLLGFDAAIKWNDDHNIPSDNRIIGLCEGVLDAARMGPPFCSIMGAGISGNQYSLIRRVFKRIIYASDHDQAGKSLESTLLSKMEAFGDKDNIRVKKLIYPDRFKDLGEITNEEIVKNLKSQVVGF